MIDCKLDRAPVTAERIDLVRPELHHLGSLGQALVAVVDRGNRCVDMLKLEVNRLLGEARQLCAIDRDPLSIQQGRGARPEAMWAMRALIAEAVERDLQCIRRDRPTLTIGKQVTTIAGLLFSSRSNATACRDSGT